MNMTYHGMQVIGTCSLCGGRVVMPTLWSGINPPVPSCTSCGATKKQPNGPIIEMENPRPAKWEVK